jgi:hypothetical protein
MNRVGLIFWFNQSSVLCRCMTLFTTLILITLLWYFLLMNHLWQDDHSKLVAREKGRVTLSQLQQLDALKDNYVYEDELDDVELKDVLEGLVLDNANLAVMGIQEINTKISTGAQLYSLALEELGVSFVPKLPKKTVHMKLVGGFYGFADYLKAIEASHHDIYFHKLDFTMQVFPEADIRLDVFTIGRGV